MTLSPSPLQGRLILASHNPGKLVELRTLVRPWGLEVASAGGLGLPEAEESADTFEGNATLKAVSAARHAGSVALADDTGLVVPKLGGRPGVQTARYAAQHRSWKAARLALADEVGLRESNEASAELYCALCLAWPSGAQIVESARIDGRLVWPPNPSLPGFAAMFEPNEELISHRGILAHRRLAFARLNAVLRDRELL